MCPKTRSSFSLSDELLEEIDNRRGLAKKSTFVEYQLRKSLGMELEEEDLERRRRPVRPIAR